MVRCPLAGGLPRGVGVVQISFIIFFQAVLGRFSLWQTMLFLVFRSLFAFNYVTPLLVVVAFLFLFLRNAFEKLRSFAAKINSKIVALSDMVMILTAAVLFVTSRGTGSSGKPVHCSQLLMQKRNYNFLCEIGSLNALLYLLIFFYDFVREKVNSATFSEA